MSTRKRPVRTVRRRRRKGLPKPLGILVVSLVGLVVLAGLGLLGFRLVRSGSLPNVIVASENVGALDEVELRSALEDLERDLQKNSVTLRRGGTPIAEPATAEVIPEEVGYQIDVDATVERILTHGRQGNPIEALWDQLRASFGTIDVEPVDFLQVFTIHVTDEDPPSGPLEHVARELSAPPFDGGVAFSGQDVEPRYPEPGVLVSGTDLVETVLHAIRTSNEGPITIKGRPAHPATDKADVDALVETAERAVDGRVELTLGARSLTFTPEDIGRAIATTTTEAGDELMLEVRAKAVREKLEGVDSLETPPVDARFETSGESVSVVPARPGFTFVPKVTARQLLTVALKKGASEAPLKGKKEPAEFTTADAKALDIEERVSTFTTFHSCCEPRVENIHRIADIVDGSIVEPGETYSLNDEVGPRTTSNGFVPAPSIRDGEFVQEVGGGISQFATTTFNAIFFGGYDFLVYQPHSYYISRYPPGREATISTPAPDLAFLNDTDAGVLIDTSYTEESITVSFYGNTDFEVDSVTGPQKNVKEPKVLCRENESLARGEEIVRQEGITGFDIVVTRVFSDGRPDETFSTHYDMQRRIVERRRCRKKR